MSIRPDKKIKCAICHRPLKVTKSILKGKGARCAKKTAKQLAIEFEEWVEREEYISPFDKKKFKVLKKVGNKEEIRLIAI